MDSPGQDTHVCPACCHLVTVCLFQREPVSPSASDHSREHAEEHQPVLRGSSNTIRQHQRSEPHTCTGKPSTRAAFTDYCSFPHYLNINLCFSPEVRHLVDTGEEVGLNADCGDIIRLPSPRFLQESELSFNLIGSWSLPPVKL